MTLTVYYNGAPLRIFPAVAKRLGLQPGQKLRTQQEFFEVVDQNAAHLALLIGAASRERN